MDVLKLSRSSSCVVLMMVALLSLQAVQLQEGDNFRIGLEISEGYTAGLLQSDLFLNIDGPVLPQIGNYGFNASQGLRLDPGSAISLEFTAAGPVPVGWIDYYIKPVFAAGKDLPVNFALGQAALAGFVRLDALGGVYVLHGDRNGNGVWLPTAYQTPLRDNMATQWLRMTYRLDYANLTWDLFLDGQLSRFDLGFIDPNVPPLSGFSLKGSPLGSTYLDQFEAGFHNPLYQDTDNDGMSDEYEQAQGLDVTRDDRSEDADHDGLSNIQELHLGLQAGDPDSDDDGRSDGAEYQRGANPLEADPYSLTVLPFEEDFETYAPGMLDGHKNWQFDGGLTTVVAPADSVVGQFLELTASPGLTLDLSNAFNGSAASIVWTEFDILPIYFNSSRAAKPKELAMDGKHSAIFYFSKEPALVAYDGKRAQFMNYPLELDAEAPQRITLRHDYTTQTWSLWCNAVLVAPDLGFAQPQPFYSHLKFTQESEQPATLDNLRVAVTRPPGLDSDGDGLPDEVEDPNANEIRDPGETDLFNPDTDGDGILDSLESLWTADPVQDAAPLTLNPSGYKTLSFHFESEEGYTTGPLAGQLGWEAAPVFEVSEDRAVTPSLQSLRSEASVSLDAFAYARHYLSAEGEPVVWVSFQADMKGVNLDAIPVDTRNPAAAFALSPARRVSAYDALAGEWKVAPERMPEDEWIRYDLRLDYAERSWSLCANGQMVFDELPFVDPDHASLSSLTLLQQGGDAAGKNWIDAIEFSNVEPEGLDFDGDGLANRLEREAGSDLFSSDTDRDGMDDLWEYQNGLDLLNNDAGLDADGDGLSNGVEYTLGSNAQVADSDRDGFNDLDEFYAGTSVTDLTDAPEAIGLGDWQIADVGNVSGARGYTVDGRYVLHAKGSGIGARDRHGFFYQNFTGNYSLIIRVHALEAGYIGLNVRGSLDDSAWMNWGYVGYRGRCRIHSRTEDNGTLSHTPYIRKFNNFPDVYLKLERTGSRFTTYRSADGENWLFMGGVTIDAGDSTLAGISFAAGSNSTEKRAEVEVLSIILDQDSDGISDDDETLYGTLINNADTDGDGVSDYDEVFVVFSDPLVADFDGTVTLVTSLTGSSYTDALGDWYKIGGVLFSRSLRGHVDYTITTVDSGSFRLDITGGQNNAHSTEQRFELNLYVDGQFVGKDYIEAAYPNSGTVSFYLPYLAAGEHTVRIEWLNGEPGSSLKLEQIDVLELGGADLEANGVVDWLDSHIQAVSDFDATTIYTAVSPFTMEGNAVHPGFVTIDSSYIGNPENSDAIVVQEGLIGQYFAHIPLDPVADTELGIEEQNGLLSFDKTVIWTATNLLNSGDILLRDDDSLLLAAYTDSFNTSEAVTIVIKDSQGNALTGYRMTAADAIPHEFDQAGRFTVEVTLEPTSGDPLTASVSVQVIAANFGVAPRIVFGNSRGWTVAGLPAEAEIDADRHLSFEEVAPINGDRRFNLSSNSTGNATVLARLGKNGPIITRTTVHTLVDYDYTEPYWLIVDIFDDGTELWSASLNLGGDIPDDLSVKIRIFKAGVTFLDGTVEKIITNDDLDELGVYRYYMLRPKSSRGSTCHMTTIYQGGEQINTTY